MGAVVWPLNVALLALSWLLKSSHSDHSNSQLRQIPTFGPSDLIDI